MNEPRYRIKLSNLYVVLLDEELIEESYLYDLCINKKHAEKFTKSVAIQFLEKWKILEEFNVYFSIEEIKRN